MMGVEICANSLIRQPAQKSVPNKANDVLIIPRGKTAQQICCFSDNINCIQKRAGIPWNSKPVSSRSPKSAIYPLRFYLGFLDIEALPR